ncbi:MAG: CPBP family intramembrane metalloprotease [Oscillospiraceae bacterium]|nr:CPBP family intramembrane metalloprotease [Oscillospiraceae bacterium]
MDTQNITPPQAEMYCGVTVKPDKEEKKLIRRQYLKAGAVIYLNIILFNIVLMLIVYLIGGLYTGDMSSLKAMEQGVQKLFTDKPWADTLISCCVPIISETAAIIFGARLLKINFRRLFTRDGFNGKELMMSGSICLGMQTLSAVIIVIGDMILKMFGFESKTVEIVATENSVGATILLYFYACLLGPLLEELLYRGVLLQGMRKYNERFALIISALIFGLMHQNYQQFVLGFLVGLVLGAITLRSGSIVPAIIFHIILNTTSSLASLAMQAADYEAFTLSASGNITVDTIMSAEPAFIIILLVNAVFRYGFMFAMIPLLIISIVKKRGVRTPTPAGKTRGWPVLAQSLIWYLILVSYIILNFRNIVYTG